MPAICTSLSSAYDFCGAGLLAAFGFAGTAGSTGIAGAISIFDASTAFAASMSAGELAAKAWRSGSLKAAVVCGGSSEASANFTTVSLSVLVSRLATTGLLMIASSVATPASGTLSRPRILMTAAPATKRQVIAMIVMAFVKQCSLPRPGTVLVAES